MADVCEALADIYQLVHGLQAGAGRRRHRWLWLSTEKADAPDSVRVCEVVDLLTRLEGAVVELRRLRAELSRHEVS